MAQGRAQAAPQIASDVIVAPATPPGESAIGIVRLSGPGCLAVAAEFVRWPRSRGGLPARTAVLAKAYSDGRLLDHVLVTYFPGPASYSGEDIVEIAAHGSPFVLAKLLEQALACGARAAEPGECTQRAFLNGRLDLAQAEAVCGLIRARTRLAHRAAVDQLEGGLSSRMEALRSELLDVLAQLEADLDHPDDDLPAAVPTELSGRLDALRRELAALAATHRVGRLLNDGARIAIVGRPNVGKSSLLNALLGRDRAIVSEIPGTTRDTLEEWADLDGLKAVFIDTAGLRDQTSDSVERAGMQRSLRALESCDLALVVLDRSRPIGDNDRIVLDAVGSDRPAIFVLNKSDLPDRLGSVASHFARENSKEEAPICVSALSGRGLGELARTMRGKLLGGAPMEESGVLITSIRHQQSLLEAERAIARAQQAISRAEIAALHLHEGLGALGTVVGETSPEEILNAVFSKFCVGK